MPARISSGVCASFSVVISVSSSRRNLGHQGPDRGHVIRFDLPATALQVADVALGDAAWQKLRKVGHVCGKLFLGEPQEPAVFSECGGASHG